MRDYTDEELLKSLQEYVTESGRQVARELSYLHLITSDGCSRIVHWQGEPPRIFRTPLSNPVSFQTKEESVYEHPREREYEFDGYEGQKTWRYREVIK